MYEIKQGDCLEVMDSIQENSVDLIVSDPPYFKVKNERWDNQWKNPEQFLAWLDKVLTEFQRVLKPNGSLYLFASPQMAARVEMLISKRFKVLNSIRWYKSSGWHRKTKKEALNRYLTPWEACIFAEKPRHDRNPLANAIYLARASAGMKATDVDVALGYVRTKDPSRGTELCRRWEEGSSIPTAEDFARVMSLCSASCNYDELYSEYQMTTRPFLVTEETPSTDMWVFDPVKFYPGKHPCEKPQEMIEHIIAASSRPGDIIFDAFMGSGSTGAAAMKLGRKFIGVELNPEYIAISRKRLQDYPEKQPQIEENWLAEFMELEVA
jgi:site-specific DNA-methyltransferase (adenine-specific)